jgi:hypothetical protein
MSYKGDFLIGATVDFKFTTVDDAGLPATLSGTPVVSAYPNNGTTEITAGVTLTVDFDAKTGLNHVRIVASEANGYARGTDYELVITAGTSGGDSIVGYTVGSFSVENRWPLNKAVGRFVVGTGSTTGSIVTSSCTPPGASENQFVGCVIIFDADTPTPELRGQRSAIQAATNAANPIFTLTDTAPLTVPPVSGDHGSFT